MCVYFTNVCADQKVTGKKRERASERVYRELKPNENIKYLGSVRDKTDSHEQDLIRRQK
jgi:hypothetical protein